MLEIKHTWPVYNGDSGGLTAIEVQSGALESVLYVQCSTIASTFSFQFQTGLSSAGPWATEGSTSISATGSLTSCDRIRVTGPFTWMRPYFPTKSTGTHTVCLMSVG